MSSIAYVTDEEMLEYHRLCRNKTMLFWRLTDRKKFKNFHKGDLLFFYAKPYRGRKKALIGYAHFDSIKPIKYENIWKRFGETTGYATEQRFHDAINKASRGKIPERMNCLFLTDVVFFLSPIYPEEFGMQIPQKLESYQYLDKEDTEVTVSILQCADKHGLDLWSTDPNKTKNDIFHADMLRQQIASINHNYGPDTRSNAEKANCHKLTKELNQNKEWELIKNSKTDYICLEKDKLHIAIPFVYQSNDEEIRVRELYGKVYMYQLQLKKMKIDKVVYHILSNQENNQVKELVNELKHV